MIIRPLSDTVGEIDEMLSIARIGSNETVNASRNEYGDFIWITERYCPILKVCLGHWRRERPRPRPRTNENEDELEWIQVLGCPTSASADDNNIQHDLERVSLYNFSFRSIILKKDAQSDDVEQEDVSSMFLLRPREI